MKKVTLVATVAVVLFYAGSAFTVDPFAGLMITPPDESVSPEVRALFGKSGKWGGKGEWDGEKWKGGGTDGIWFASPTLFGARAAIDRQPGNLAVLNLTNETAKLHIGYGTNFSKYCGATVKVDKDFGICLQAEDIGYPFSRSGNPPVFCLKDGKIEGKWRGDWTIQTVTFVPLE